MRRSFEPSRNLTSSVAGEGKCRFNSERWHNGSLDITVGADGVIYTAWTDYEGTLTLRRSRDAGKTFEPAVIVAAKGPLPARAPTIAVRSGLICLAWTVGEDTNADIRVACSKDGATFSAPAIVEQSRGYADGPKLAFDSRGTLHLAYSETNGGPFDAAEVRYTRSRDGKTFERSRVISLPHASGVGAAFPSLAIDRDRVFVTWEYYPRAGEQPHGIGIAYSYDDGASFTRPALIEGTRDRGPNGGAEGRLTRKLAVRDDAIAVVNSSRVAGESSRVWLVRGRLPPATASR